MSTSTAAEGSIAALLVAARTEGRSLPGFPGDRPAGMAEAYRIQELAMAGWADTLVGWKIGYIPPERRDPDSPDRLVGPIWQRQLHAGDEVASPPVVDIFSSGFAAVEAELVVRLDQDLPDHDGGWTADEVADLDQQLGFGIEVASSPVPDINSLGPTVIAADFGNNNGLVLGPPLPELGTAGPLSLSCFIDGRLVGKGGADNLPGGMHHGLATALNVLSGRGRRVRAGTLFATGAITGIHPIGPGQHCRVEVGGGPSVELRTADAPAGQRS
jgi:2-keto-4-pentenoate hydratase